MTCSFLWWLNLRTGRELKWFTLCLEVSVCRKDSWIPELLDSKTYYAVSTQKIHSCNKNKSPICYIKSPLIPQQNAIHLAETSSSGSSMFNLQTNCVVKVPAFRLHWEHPHGAKVNFPVISPDRFSKWKCQFHIFFLGWSKIIIFFSIMSRSSFWLISRSFYKAGHSISCL